MTQVTWKKWLDKLLRNWYGIAAIPAKFLLPFLHLPAGLMTVVDLILTFFVIAFGANLAVHAFTKIAWRRSTYDTVNADGSTTTAPLPEFVIAANRIALGLMFLGCCYVAGSMYAGKEQTATVQQVNEELQAADSVKAIPNELIHSLPNNSVDTLYLDNHGSVK